jgi:uncharacterized protein (TIGR02266 family)
VLSASEKVQPGYAANISAAGMFLRTDTNLAVGALVSVALELPDGDRPAPLEGKVVHVVGPAQVRSGWSGAGVGIQFIASDHSVRGRLDRYLELLALTTPALERPKRTYYPRLRAPVYWTALGLPFIRRRMSVQDLGGVRVYLDEKLKDGARLEIEVFLPDGTSLVCRVEVAWVDGLPEGAVARFEAGLKFTAIAPLDRERISSVLEQA